jgi:hypothetical protein
MAEHLEYRSTNLIMCQIPCRDPQAELEPDSRLSDMVALPESFDDVSPYMGSARSISKVDTR